MGLGRVVLIAMALAVAAIPALATESDGEPVTLDVVEVAAVHALLAVEPVTVPWQPLFAGVDTVQEGANPIIGFAAWAAPVGEVGSVIGRPLPTDSPLTQLQAGTPSFYDGEDVVTFALLQSVTPVDVASGDAAEFAFFWRRAGLPTHPANPDANGDAAAGASNTFSLGSLEGEPHAMYGQTNGTTFIEQDAGVIAAWEFAAGDTYNLLIAVPGLPEVFWGSALSGATSNDESTFGVQIGPQLPAVVSPRPLSVSMVITDAEGIALWTTISAAGQFRTNESEPTSGDQGNPGAALPANPPVEVDTSGDPVAADADDESRSLWGWIVGVFLGAAVVAVALFALPSRTSRTSDPSPGDGVRRDTESPSGESLGTNDDRVERHRQ